MAAQRRASPKGLLFTSLGMIALSVGVLFLGGWNLQTLKSTYLLNDVARLESPESFRAWLVKLSEQRAEDTDTASGIISERLLVMSLQNRRRFVSAAVSDEFWDDLRLAQGERQTLIEATLLGVLKALERAPSLGDLWLLAAKLDTRLNGFSDSVRNQLRASQIYAPRETGLVLERVKLGAVLWPLLNTQDKGHFRTDLTLLKNSNSSRFKKVARELEQAGVEIE